jgi:UDP-3-O-[3-hydroxymyristoyl] N-acetylglucosamine deacetylase
MRVIQQTTIARTVTLSGLALHSGAPARATLRPAIANAGIGFRRSDAPTGERMIEAAASAVASTRRATTIANFHGRTLATVEHVLAAISLCGVDNIIIEVDGAEAPILDGSAGPWMEAIEQAGVRPLAAPREALRIMSPIEIIEGDRYIRAEPFDGRAVDVEIDFEDAAIGRQAATIDLDNRRDCRRIAAARTFCRLADVERLRAGGLSLGGSLDNAVVVDGAHILNPGGLRDPQEFALHKILDLVGDLALAGAPVIGRIRARKPGHDLNARFAAALADNRAAVERIVLAAAAERLPA